MGAWRAFRKYKILYLMMVPALLWYVVYRYAPMYGLIISFKNFNFRKGIWGSEWVGLEQFRFLFQYPDFYRILKNTIIINIYELLFVFPIPILTAILLNELRSLLLKRTIQTVIYFPHFLSWVVFGGIIIQLLSPNDGVVNTVIAYLGGTPIHFMVQEDYFRSIVIGSLIMKETGWSAIIYLAAISGIDPEQYEAATIDGASRWRKMFHITLPGIRNTIIILLILKIGQMLDYGFEQIYVLYTPTTYSVGDVISTYIYRIGLQNAQFSMTAAIGMFQSVLGCVLIVIANYFARKYSEQASLW